MLVSTKARYAVSALVDLSLVTKDNSLKAVSLRDIAERQELPIPYLEQIFAKLRKASLVQSIRGAHGGYALSRSSENIRIADIIYAVDTPTRATRCDHQTSKGCMSTGKRCLTHDLWEGLDLVVHHYFSQITLSDIINRSSFHASSFFSLTPQLEQKKKQPVNASDFIDFNTVNTSSFFTEKSENQEDPLLLQKKGGSYVL